MRVTIQRPGGIGDSLLMAPALRALRLDYPGAHISYGGQPAGAAWLHHVGLVDECCDVGEERPPADVLIGFTFQPRAWRREHGNTAHIATACPWIGPAGTHQAFHQYQQVRRALPIWSGFDAGPLSFPVPGHERRRYHRTIVLAAGTSHPLKVWPHFDALADALIDTGHEVLFLEPRDGYPSFAGSFVEASEVIAAAALVIGNDSCAVHAAGLAGTPSIALFGPSLPAHWQPIGVGSVVIHGCPRLLGRCDTRAVIACDGADCWDLAPLDRVLDTAERLLRL